MKQAWVVGSGPNGFAAAITLARAGLRVTLLEAQPTIGGGMRSAELTLPGFVHDICSAVHPMAAGSPVFNSFPLREHGLEWIRSPSALAHPLPDGSCALLDQSVDETARRLGRDGPVWRRIMAPLSARWDALAEDILAPPHWPKHPQLFARFGMFAPWPAAACARTLFRTPAARALFAGNAAHSFLPLESPGSAAFGMVLTLTAHAVGWPIARGGSQSIVHALQSYFESLGGKVVSNRTVRSLAEFNPDDLVLCDIGPRQLIGIAGDRLPDAYLRKLRNFRYGPGVFKLDWALDGPIPWRNTDCARAATVHIGGTLEQIADSERSPSRNRTQVRPFVLLAQQSLFDPARAPAGKHTAWAYCHVPNGSREDMIERIEGQVEAFAPGFRAKILARHAMDTAAMETQNANLVGGDINGGSADLRQLFLRPTASMYATPHPRVFLCSASTPPGGGVHGMCGYHAAQAALRSLGT
jgi:phytoene dehydrogenase-like protein